MAFLGHIISSEGVVKEIILNEWDKVYFGSSIKNHYGDESSYQLKSPCKPAIMGIDMSYFLDDQVSLEIVSTRLRMLYVTTKYRTVLAASARRCITILDHSGGC